MEVVVGKKENNIKKVNTKRKEVVSRKKKGSWTLEMR